MLSTVSIILVSSGNLDPGLLRKNLPGWARKTSHSKKILACSHILESTQSNTHFDTHAINQCWRLISDSCPSSISDGHWIAENAFFLPVYFCLCLVLAWCRCQRRHQHRTERGGRLCTGVYKCEAAPIMYMKAKWAHPESPKIGTTLLKGKIIRCVSAIYIYIYLYTYLLLWSIYIFIYVFVCHLTEIIHFL